MTAMRLRASSMVVLPKKTRTRRALCRLAIPAMDRVKLVVTVTGETETVLTLTASAAPRDSATLHTSIGGSRWVEITPLQVRGALADAPSETAAPSKKAAPTPEAAKTHSSRVRPSVVQLGPEPEGGVRRHGSNIRACCFDGERRTLTSLSVSIFGCSTLGFRSQRCTDVWLS